MHKFFRAFKEKPHIILCMYLGVYKDVYVYNQCKGIKPAITDFDFLNFRCFFHFLQYKFLLISLLSSQLK